MTQAQLERAVCRATGETRERIHNIGFSLMVLPSGSHRRNRGRHRRRKNRHDDRLLASQRVA
jgi:hypothetical protein